jgi:hypothetical protein
MAESGLRIRVDSRLREDFLRACKKDDLTGAQVLRAFMRSYIENRYRGSQPDLFGITSELSGTSVGGTQ